LKVYWEKPEGFFTGFSVQIKSASGEFIRVDSCDDIKNLSMCLVFMGDLEKKPFSLGVNDHLEIRVAAKSDNLVGPWSEP
jgi:hypothetical protein